MILRLRSSHFRFVYTFESGYQLVGTLTGDHYSNQPDHIFNLRSLKAVCLSPDGNLVMSFDDVFGQFKLTQADTILSASHAETGSFFSINYRNGEACVYDATRDRWLATGWSPTNWKVRGQVKLQPKSLPTLNMSAPVCPYPAIA